MVNVVRMIERREIVVIMKYGKKREEESVIGVIGMIVVSGNFFDVGIGGIVFFVVIEMSIIWMMMKKDGLRFCIGGDVVGIINFIYNG